MTLHIFWIGLIKLAGEPEQVAQMLLRSGKDQNEPTSRAKYNIL